MPQIIHVKKARQRYRMKPIIDPDTGQPKREEVNRKRKRGDQPVYRTLSEPDKEQPITDHCDYPVCPQPDKIIQPGTAMKVIKIKQQFGGITRRRHETCPTWKPHEYSNSLSAQASQIQDEADIDYSGWETEQDARDCATAIADSIRELAEEKQGSLDNMPEGLQQGDTGQMLQEAVENLESWAEEVESAVDNADDFPDGKCGNCQGEQLDCSDHEGHSDDPDAENYCDGTEECMECHGSGEGDDVDEQELNEWRESAAQAIQDALDNCQV
jgi:hypothetical protein